jgi:hypothetical protein
MPSCVARLKLFLNYKKYMKKIFSQAFAKSLEAGLYAGSRQHACRLWRQGLAARRGLRRRG